MVYLKRNLQFNPNFPNVMHIDINSCFATIEQQANHLIRNKPVIIAARNTKYACIVAASIEAKKLGIKTGLKVSDAKKIYNNIIVLVPDPPKYRYVHNHMKKIIEKYTPKFEPKSIDEFVLHFEDNAFSDNKIKKIAREIKKEINSEIGEWIKVSVGMGPNRFLAKTAAGLKKPDGLEEINIKNFLHVYKKLALTDLHGINFRNEFRLNNVGIFTVRQFYNASVSHLRSAFRSVLANYWYIKLRGWEIDDYKTVRRTFGHSYVLPTSTSEKSKILPILQKLTEKTGEKMRRSGYKTKTLHIGIIFEKYTKQKIYWHKGITLSKCIFDSQDMFRRFIKTLSRCEHYERVPIRKIAVTVSNLSRINHTQLELFEDVRKKQQKVKFLDQINKKWGQFTISPARMILAKNDIKDSIAFGNIETIYSKKSKPNPTRRCYY